MAIYLGHTTAQRILESRLALELQPVPRHRMHNCETTRKAVVSELRGRGLDMPTPNELSQLFYGRAKEPLDLMCDSHRGRRTWNGCLCHVCEPTLPAGSFMQLDSGIYVASPGLCLVQLAPQLSEIEIAKLAMSFCGIYQLEGDVSRKPYERSPLATPQEILDYVDGIQGTHGAKAVKDAMRWVLPNSGSPMETRMVLPLYLPRRLGGYGLPRPTMNALIRLTGEEARIAGQSVCYGDAVWKCEGRRPLDFEFQSREYHDVSERYGLDYARQLALQRKGYVVQFVTSLQLGDEHQLNELARMVSSHTGTWLPQEAYKWDDLRRQMNREVQS